MMKKTHDSKSEFKRFTIVDGHPELLDDPIITLEHTDLFFRVMHAASKCAGQPCTIHNRTDHNMRSFKQHWRGDRGIMERICTHGVGHPDPDDFKMNDESERIHGCDGCCYMPKTEGE